jgi:hypothetical protein
MLIFLSYANLGLMIMSCSRWRISFHSHAITILTLSGEERRRGLRRQHIAGASKAASGLVIRINIAIYSSSRISISRIHFRLHFYFTNVFS